ncbi:MAG: DUF4215 domain-containing protein [Myxococcota bacterium]
MRSGWLALGLLALPGCTFDAAFACDDAQSCTLRPEGACDLSGWCSYPSEDCPSGRVFGPYAPEGIAGACVDPATGSGGPEGDASSSSTSGDPTATSTSTTGDPIAVCGNGIVEDGEQCDDGNDVPGDGCHPLCVEPYQPAWTQDYNEADGEDRGFAVDVDAQRGAIYVVGLTETTDTSGNDLLVQRYSLSSGALSWTWSRDAAQGTDTAEQVAIDAVGNAVVGGVETDEVGVEHAWLAAFSPDGTMQWERRDDVGAKAEGIAVGDDGRIVASGRTGTLGTSSAWHQWYQADGTPDAEPVLLGNPDADSDGGVDVIAVPGVGVQITGYRTVEGVANLWTTRFDGGGGMLWEHLIPDPEGDLPRGVGQALSPLGGTAIVGTRNTNRFVQFYDDDGVPVGEGWEEGEPGQDEVADIAFLDDGRYVLVGFIGFNLSSTGTADGWIRFNDPDGTLIDQFPVSGTGGGVDKLLAVENAPHSVIVTGYVKNEDTDIDLWLRRYAI